MVYARETLNTIENFIMILSISYFVGIGLHILCIFEDLYGNEDENFFNYF